MAAPRLQPINVSDFIPWKRQDDIRLAEVVRPLTDVQQVTEGAIVILGIPDDRGVAVNHGRIGTRHGPSVFRQCFYRLTLGANNELMDIPLWDAGDLVLEDHVDATHESLRRAVAALHRRGALVIVLGGGHDSSYGGLMGVRDVYPGAKLVNIDAHLDLRPREPDGQVGSGTAFRRLIEEGKIPGDDIYSLGFHEHCTTAPHMEFARENGMHLWSWRDLNRGGRHKVLTDIAHHLAHHESVAISWDVDSLCGTCAPGVSAPASVGFNVEDVIWIAELLGAHNSIRHLEIMEINPKADLSGTTSRLMAVMLWRFLATRLRAE